MFLGTVMAHEATHGHMGMSGRANIWWGRFALLSSMVPFTNFRKTHLLHHAHTNDPDKDPDYFVRHGAFWEIPLRAVTMPHQWFIWLKRRNKIHKRDLIDLLFNYIGIFAIYGSIAYFTGVPRVVYAMVPALVLESLLLWYPFANLTHQGYRLGPEEERSHNYYGRFMYWFTLGLSMHREHHMWPKLSWIELLPRVKSAPGPLWKKWIPTRDVQWSKTTP